MLPQKRPRSQTSELCTEVKALLGNMHRKLALAIKSSNQQILAEDCAKTLYDLHAAYNSLAGTEKAKINLSNPEKRFFNNPLSGDGARTAIRERLGEYAHGGSSAMLSGTRYNSSRCSENVNEKDVRVIAAMTLRAVGVLAPGERDGARKLVKLIEPIATMRTYDKVLFSCQTITLLTAYTSCINMNPEYCKKMIQGGPTMRADRPGEVHTSNVIPVDLQSLERSTLFRFWLGVYLTNNNTGSDLQNLVVQALASTRKLKLS